MSFRNSIKGRLESNQVLGDLIQPTWSGMGKAARERGGCRNPPRQQWMFRGWAAQVRRGFLFPWHGWITPVLLENHHAKVGFLLEKEILCLCLYLRL